MMLKHPTPGLARRATGRVFVVALSMAIGYAAWAAEPAMPAPPAPPQALPLAPQPPSPPQVSSDVATPPAPPLQLIAPQPPAPPALPAEPAPPADAAKPAEPAAVADPAEPTPAVAPTAAVSDTPAAPAAPPATAWIAALGGGPLNVTATAANTMSDQEVELRNVRLAAGEPPHSVITADLARRGSDGEWLFEGNVVVETDAATVRTDQLKFTRNGVLETPGPVQVTKH
jgi:hypothetical protein